MKAVKISFDRPLAYAQAMSLQDRLVADRIAGKVPDTVLFLEHEPVITMGVRAQLDHVLLEPAELKRRGLHTAVATRGGDATWHGPGQLVMYPIIKLGDTESDLHGYLHNLEEIAIRTAGDFGVDAFRRKKLTGAWTGAGKLAAIGVRFKRWIAFHGMSFNVRPDLSGFGAIVPCGLKGERVTSLREIMKEKCPSVEEVRRRMAVHFTRVCGRRLLPYKADKLLHPELDRVLFPYSDDICRATAD